MTAFVMDASVALGQVLPDELNSRAARLFELLRTATALVPPLWELEVGNVLLSAVRRRRITLDDADRAMLALSRAAIMERRVPLGIRDLVTLADRLGLTVYDATYVALAVSERLPLATLDDKLQAACGRAGVQSLTLP